MKIHYSNSINQKDFTDILNQEFDLDITMKEVEESLYNYNNQINYFYFHCLKKDFSESDFNKYLVDNFLTIEFINAFSINQLLLILNKIPQKYAFDFIHLIKSNKTYNKDKFVTTNNFLNNDKIKNIIKAMNIKDF